MIKQPEISKELIEYLHTVFPGVVSKQYLTMTPQEIGVQVGISYLIEHLETLYKDQTEQD